MSLSASNGSPQRMRSESANSRGFDVKDENSATPPPPYSTVPELRIFSPDNDTDVHPGYENGKLYSSHENLELEPCLSKSEEEVCVEFQDPNRATWGGKLEFLLTMIGYAVGLGNVWRFPYLCYKNGGGAFLLPFIIMVCLVGLPLFFLEVCFGQFASLGPITIWRISPLFKGLGVAMVMVSFIIAIYYNVVVSQCLFYLASSIIGPMIQGGKLPWADCCNSWNTEYCRELELSKALQNKSLTPVLSNFSCRGTVSGALVANMSRQLMDNETRSPAEEFFEFYLLHRTSGIEDMGILNWKMLLALSVAWLLVILVLLKGIQSLGKVSYFTALFPYVMLTILLIRGLTLPGSWDGILFYVTPQWSRLKDYRVWMEAATQIFFSLSCCNGGLIVMSSYNKFKNNCQRDACIVAFMDAGTCIFAGFVVFANLGFMANQKGVPISQVARGGPGLAFVVYPEALTQMPLPPLWSILFFIMMATLGFGSEFSIVETVLSAFEDELRAYGILDKKKWKVFLYRILMCLLLFCLGIPMIMGGGMYVLNLVDTIMASFPLMICGLCEITALMYIYGYTQVANDIKLMVGGKPSLFWKATWCVITPIILLVLLILMLAFNEGIKYGDYKYPYWANVLGQFIGVFVVIWIPLYACYKYCKEGGLLLCKEFVKPVEDWGPAKAKHREIFLDALPDTSDKGSGFFQSKLSIAAELQRVASKESLTSKRVRSNTTSLSGHRSASTPQFNIQIDKKLIVSAANISSSNCKTSAANNDIPFSAPTFTVGEQKSEVEKGTIV